MANSVVGAVHCIPSTTMALKKSLTAFSPKRACPSQRARLEPMSLALLESGAPTVDSAGLGHPSRVMRVDMQTSDCEKRKINIGEQGTNAGDRRRTLSPVRKIRRIRLHGPPPFPMPVRRPHPAGKRAAAQRASLGVSKQLPEIRRLAPAGGSPGKSSSYAPQ